MDRNTGGLKVIVFSITSLSARRAWIEITLLVYLALIRYVALRKESVDRNLLCLIFPLFRWNVALRKESVDRNLRQVRLFGLGLGSLSARRAWIEIIDQLAH